MPNMRQRILGWPEAIVAVALILIAVGVITHGFHHSEFARGWQNLVSRPGRKLAFRFVLQPVISAIFAIRDGIKDARTGRSPYFWSIVSASPARSARLREGLTATGKIFLLAVIIDIVYQTLELNEFYPGEALAVASLLAFVPYLVIRGPAARIARRWWNRNAIRDRS
jgi:hypothetical protein